jgi:hypothetical protein
MAEYFSPLSAPRAEMNIFEMNEKLCCQLEAAKSSSKTWKRNFLCLKLLHIPLANQLWKYI